MNRLSGPDSMFLSLETPRWPLHVGGVSILDPSDAPDFSFERVCQNCAERIVRVPKLTWKLKEVPFGLDRPVWVEDRDFDVRRHFERVRVKAPGGRRELGELAGELMAEPLDRRLPLWKQWYIDGLAGGRIGLFAKQHHCLMDGAAGTALSEVLMDVEPNPVLSPAQVPTEKPPREPSDLELLLASGVHLTMMPARAASYVAAVARRFARVGPQVLRNGAAIAPMAAPPTGFNRMVGARRALSFISVSLADVKAVRKSLGVTVNDVVVGVSAGALVRYLDQVGQRLPAQALTASVPISMHAAEDRELTNRVSGITASMATDVKDPVERVRAISRSIAPGKKNARAFQTAPLPSATELVPPVVIMAASRAMQLPFFAPLAPVGMNTIVSNMMGPPRTLYVAGAKVTGIYSASVLMLKMGVNFTVLSYDGRIDFGITVDPEIVPDPWLIADGVPMALAELMAASGVGQPQPVIDPIA